MSQSFGGRGLDEIPLKTENRKRHTEGIIVQKFDQEVYLWRVLSDGTVSTYLW